MSFNGTHKLHPDYLPDPPGPWKMWFAWFPVQGKNNSFVWFKTVLRREVGELNWAGGEVFSDTRRWEYCFDEFEILRIVE